MWPWKQQYVRAQQAALMELILSATADYLNDRINAFLIIKRRISTTLWTICHLACEFQQDAGRSITDVTAMEACLVTSDIWSVFIVRWTYSKPRTAAINVQQRMRQMQLLCHISFDVALARLHQR